MRREDIESADRLVKLGLVVVGVATLAVLAATVLREEARTDWQAYRNQYAKILDGKATDDRSRAVADQFAVRVQQNVLPELGTIDRCTTCHTGLEDPRMADEEPPFTTHPGKYMAIHPPEQFGCTMCHEGQGRALEADAAHGHVKHWLSPILPKRHMFATCAKCHDENELYGGPNLPARAGGGESEGARLLALGKELADQSGCRGCHIVDGLGGTIGPDISAVGDKTYHEFDFSHLDADGPHDTAHWLKEHFLSPASVSPDTQMPDMEYTDEEAEALTVYMLSMRGTEFPPTYRPAPTLEEIPVAPAGDELYAMLCSACHGKQGEAGGVATIWAPALSSPDSMAVATDEFYRAIISSGRTGTPMPAWGPASGNLTLAQIGQIVQHMRTWESSGPSVAEVLACEGRPQMGRGYYQGLCASCHGAKGRGGLGPSLNADSFLAVASDRFLASAIIQGRPGTAMTPWKHLSADAVSDLVAYLQSWQGTAPAFDAVQAGLRSGDPVENARVGRILYEDKCATCHGKAGQGNIGPSLNSSDILPAVDDRYLYRSIVEGRSGTAMPAWRHLSADDVSAIIAHLRSWQPGAALELPGLPSAGDYGLGEVHYRMSCQQCHGPEGRGGVGPQITNPAFLDAVSDATLYHWIGKGRAGSAMKGFLNEEQGVTLLKPDQIADVIAYLRHVGARGEHPPLRTAVGNPSVGGQLFKGNCVSCHGDQGEGLSGPQLRNPELLASASDGFLAATMVLGRTGTAMKSMVHGQEELGQVSRDNVQDLIAYLRVWETPGTERIDREVLEQNETVRTLGERKFVQYCAACHGPDGRGGQAGAEFFGPSLNNQEFLSAASDAFLLATIARGRSGTPMHQFGRGAGGIAFLDPQDISDIAYYIRSWQEKED